MNKDKILFIVFLVLAVLLVVFGLYYLVFYQQTPELEEGQYGNPSCVSLGCSEEAIYVGSVNSDKYYTCDCQYASRINEENIVCFKDDVEAQDAGYTKLDC